jgi:hypothetical protein
LSVRRISLGSKASTTVIEILSHQLIGKGVAVSA